MDELTHHILILLGNGKISKEAAVKALGLIKESDDRSWGQIGKEVGTVGLQHGVKGLIDQLMGAVGSGVKKIPGMLQNKDAIFQRLMQTHPGLKGKDAARAKANFNYIAEATPHLLNHELILGDQLAQMTAMGATALPTLSELAQITKMKNEGKGKTDNSFAQGLSNDLSKALVPDYQRPQVPAWVKEDPQHAGKQQAEEAFHNQRKQDWAEQHGKTLGVRPRGTPLTTPPLNDKLKGTVARATAKYEEEKQLRRMFDEKANQLGIHPDSLSRYS